ncbi:hypothetical protein DOT_2883, partial [Desulfosporosinus sp. OT]
MKIFGLEFKFNGFNLWHEGNFDPASKASTSHNHVKSQITDFPASLPANGGNADTVDGFHASSLAQNFNEASTVDIDAIVLSGMHRLNATVTGTLPSGISFSWCQLLVIHGAGDTIIQMVTNYSSNRTFIRSGNPTQAGGVGSWTAWKELASTGDNVATATKLQTARTIVLSADATGSATFDGSANATVAVTLASVGTAGTYKSVTTDAKGRVTGGTNPTTLAGYGITDAAPTSHVGSGGAAHADVTTTVDGFMIATDKVKLDGIAVGANNYAHPDTHPPSIIVQDASNRFVTDAERTTWNGKQPAITGGASTIASSNLTASRALVSDASGKVAVSSVTSTQLGYVSGVTSAIQTQLN